MQALKLTDADPDLLISPESLLKHLSKSFANLDSILKELHCSPDDLRATLDDPATSELLKLKTQLAAMQIKLLAIQYAPHAFAKNIQLMNESEKPEVTRRCTRTVLHLAGISTETKRTEPEPLPKPVPRTPREEQCTEQRNDIMKALTIGYKLERLGLDLDKIPDSRFPQIIKLLTPFIETENNPSPNPNPSPEPTTDDRRPTKTSPNL